MDAINSTAGKFVGASALNNALEGLHKSESKVAEASADLVKGFADAANFVSDSTGSGLSALAETSHTGGKGVIAPMVDIKIGAAAYSANLATLKVADEMQQTLIDTVA